MLIPITLALASMLPLTTWAPSETDEPYLEAARAAAAHLWVTATDSDRLAWPTSETPGAAISWSLYSGMPGGVLLLGWLAALDAEPRPGAFKDALAALLAAARPGPGEGLTWPGSGENESWGSPGLYTGDAGIAAVLLELYGLTQRPELSLAVHQGVTSLVARQTAAARGGHWETGTDVISGAAGIGLFLLRAHRRLHRPDALEAARAAGRWLVDQAERTGTGTRWRIVPGLQRVYPNFSHGAAGVGAFLLELHRTSPHGEWRAAAEQAATYLDGLVTEEPAGCWIWPHHEGDSLQYVSYCHGPPGTARFYQLLHRVTREPLGRERVLGAGRWLRAAGLPRPTRPLPGYWNVSRCCGTAGVGDFYLDLHAMTGDASWLTAAREIAEDLLDRSETRSGHLAWRQAEHRVRPEDLTIQTGWAQGSAGIGLFFLRLYLVESKASLPGWQLPDQPFAPLPER